MDLKWAIPCLFAGMEKYGSNLLVSITVSGCELLVSTDSIFLIVPALRSSSAVPLALIHCPKQTDAQWILVRGNHINIIDFCDPKKLLIRTGTSNDGIKVPAENWARHWKLISKSNCGLTILFWFWKVNFCYIASRWPEVGGKWQESY